MEKDARIFIAGHRGMVGSAVLRSLQRAGYKALLVAGREELDLCNQEAVRGFFQRERPSVVVLAAARVGGIVANNTYPAEFIYQNLQIAANVIDSAWRSGVKKLINLGSSCVYPRLAPQPLREESLLSGSLEPTNEAYAVAKIAAIKLCHYYRRQYGARFISVMPPNLYGPGDNFNLETSHFLPALVRKMTDAQREQAGEVWLWGDGSPRRELLHADDLAAALLLLLQREEDDWGELLNIGSGEDHSIAELAGLVAQVVGYQGLIRWDTTRPAGTPRKLLDVGRFFATGWRPQVGLREGIAGLQREYLRQLAEGNLR